MASMSSTGCFMVEADTGTHSEYGHSGVVSCVWGYFHSWGVWSLGELLGLWGDTLIHGVYGLAGTFLCDGYLPPWGYWPF